MIFNLAIIKLEMCHFKRNYVKLYLIFYKKNYRQLKVLVFLTIYFLFSLNVVKSFIIFNNENNAKRIQKEIEQKCEGNNCYVK